MSLPPTKAVRVLPDGTRIYKSGHRYKPKGRRINGRNQPDDPRAVRYNAVWFLPLPLLEDEKRVMPETRSDEEAYDHMSTNLLCMCDVCKRPGAERFRARWRQHHGLNR